MNKKMFYVNMSLILIILSFFGLFNYFVDPSMQLRPGAYALGESRIVTPGIAKSYDYTTAIIGTSTSQNILKKDVDELFHTNSMNLALSGSTNYEQRKMLKLITAKDDVTTIIYGLDLFSFNKDIYETRIPLQDYAYEKHKFPDFRYLLNYYTFEHALRTYEKRKLEGNDPNWISKKGFWGHRYEYTEQITLDSFKTPTDLNTYDYNNMISNLNETFLIIDKTPEIEYKIYLPPYSSMYWYLVSKTNDIDNLLDFKRDLIKIANEYDNVEVYDFQLDFELIDDLDNYKDKMHFSPVISLEIIESISEKKYLVENQNYDAMLIEFKKHLNEISPRYDSLLDTL